MLPESAWWLPFHQLAEVVRLEAGRPRILGLGVDHLPADRLDLLQRVLSARGVNIDIAAGSRPTLNHPILRAIWGGPRRPDLRQRTDEDRSQPSLHGQVNAGSDSGAESDSRDRSPPEHACRSGDGKGQSHVSRRKDALHVERSWSERALCLIGRLHPPRRHPRDRPGDYKAEENRKAEPDHHPSPARHALSPREAIGALLDLHSD